jgi:NADPH:quinone reductase-like Zn-dependent oxidoreductase
VKAIYLKGFGEPELLELRELPGPDIRPHDLIVAVRAAGVNRADLSHRKGAYQLARLRTSAGTLESSGSRCCEDPDSSPARRIPVRRCCLLAE